MNDERNDKPLTTATIARADVVPARNESPARAEPARRAAEPAIVGMAEVSDARIGEVRLDDIRRRVGRPIVDDGELPRRERLREQAVERAHDEAGVLERRHQNGDPRRGRGNRTHPVTARPQSGVITEAVIGIPGTSTSSASAFGASTSRKGSVVGSSW